MTIRRVLVMSGIGVLAGHATAAPPLPAEDFVLGRAAIAEAVSAGAVGARAGDPRSCGRRAAHGACGDGLRTYSGRAPLRAGRRSGRATRCSGRACAKGGAGARQRGGGGPRVARTGLACALTREPRMKQSRLLSMGAAVLLLSACYSAPVRMPAVDDARAAVYAALANPQVATYAPEELRTAVSTYERAQSLLRTGADPDEVRHVSYLAQQRAAIAREMAQLRYAEESIAIATAERERLRGRVQQAEAAARSAHLAEARADSAQRAALEAEAQARAAQRQPTIVQPAAPPLAQRKAILEKELRELAATRSDRGIVVTLNDVLFDPGSSMLRPAGSAWWRASPTFCGSTRTARSPSKGSPTARAPTRRARSCPSVAPQRYGWRWWRNASTRRACSFAATARRSRWPATRHRKGASATAGSRS